MRGSQFRALLNKFFPLNRLHTCFDDWNLSKQRYANTAEKNNDDVSHVGNTMPRANSYMTRCRASCSSRQSRGGVSGSSFGSTPKLESAAAIALPTAAATATMPPSPAPLAPKGLLGERCNSIVTPRIFGKS